ncbi:MAG: response regulator [Polyangiaceae bacterium]
MTALRVLLADDHALVRAGMRALLEDLPGVEVVGEAGDGHEALQLVRATSPDIALVDISMPTLNGLEVVTRAQKEFPRTRVVIVSMHTDDEFVRRALLAGAAGYLAKTADRAELEAALAAVARGETWLSPAVSGKLAASPTERISPRPAGNGPFEILTPRQREVLQLVAEGLSTKEIASHLKVSLKTVETHRSELMDRLGIHGVAGLVRYAIRVGLVRPEA